MKLLLLAALCVYSSQNVTKFPKRGDVLSRSKRFINWPKGSNFVISLSLVKPLLRYQPLGYSTVYEMDVPFADLPDYRIFFNQTHKSKRHVLERKHLFQQLEDFVNSMGHDGHGCINRLLCESKTLVEDREKSLLRDLIQVLFRSFLEDKDLMEYSIECEQKAPISCPFSLLRALIGSTDIDLDTTQATR